MLYDLLNEDKYVTYSSGARQEVRCNRVLGRDVRHTIDVWSRDTFMDDGSKPNTSISSATQDLAAYPWRGPLVVSGKKGLSVEVGTALCMQ